MSAARIFLGLSTLLWLPYGILCLAQPTTLADAAGVTFLSPTGSTELRAMYGGLQAAIGALALVGALRRDVERSALTALLFLCTGLAAGRLAGLASDGGASAYSLLAVAFELASAALAGWLWVRGAPPRPA